MAEIIVSTLLMMLALYLGAGVVFTLVFQLKGLNAIDEAAHGAGIGFRIIIILGCVLLWPALLKRWVKTAATQQNKPTGGEA